MPETSTNLSNAAGRQRPQHQKMSRSRDDNCSASPGVQDVQTAFQAKGSTALFHGCSAHFVMAEKRSTAAREAKIETGGAADIAAITVKTTQASVSTASHAVIQHERCG